MDDFSNDLKNFDFSDSWLLCIKYTIDEISLKIDARDLVASQQVQSRQYRMIGIRINGLRSTDISINSPKIRGQEDLGSIHQLEVSSHDDEFFIKIVMEYGQIFTYAKSVEVKPVDE